MLLLFDSKSKTDIKKNGLNKFYAKYWYIKSINYLKTIFKQLFAFALWGH